jgi:hypothetical protein
MAQIVKLRRSAVTGQKPTNSNLLLGELAINTTDGKVFLAKSGSDGPSIEELISTNTVNTGSINLIGAVTASNFVGNGAGITGVISSSYAVTSSYAGLAFTVESTPGATQLLEVTSPSTTWYFNHNLGETYPVIQVYDSNGFVVIPSSIEMFSTNTAVITFSMAQSGFATATVGGGLPAISSSYDGRILQTDGVGASWNTITDMGFATTGSNSFNGNQTITGSFNVTNGGTITGSLNVSGNTSVTGTLKVTNNAVVTGSLNVTSDAAVTGSLTVGGTMVMTNRPAFRVTGAGGAKVAVTPLTGSYLNVDFQQGGGWNTSTGTFTAPIAGLYQVNVVVRTNSNTLGTIAQLIVYKNYTGVGTGTPQIMIEFAPNTTMNHTGGSTISKLEVGETLRMVVAVGEISFDANDNFSVAYLG